MFTTNAPPVVLLFAPAAPDCVLVTPPVNEAVVNPETAPVPASVVKPDPAPAAVIVVATSAPHVSGSVDVKPVPPAKICLRRFEPVSLREPAAPASEKRNSSVPTKLVAAVRALIVFVAMATALRR